LSLGIVFERPHSRIEKKPSNQSRHTADRRGSESQNGNDANGSTSNDLNDTNGILHNSADPVVQNTTNNDVSNETDNNPILPRYVYRLGRSDRFACKYCSIVDDKWGMIKHYHAEGSRK
jgi:hypothetical protein